MTKFKYWKRKKSVFSNVKGYWENKCLGGFIAVSENTDYKGRLLGTYRVECNEHDFTMVPYKTKKEATTFAEKYMKNHDRC